MRAPSSAARTRAGKALAKGNLDPIDIDDYRQMSVDWHDGTPMYPEGDALWPVLCREALADGLLDAALLARYETEMRPPELLWPAWLAGQMAKIDSSLDRLEEEATGFMGVDAGLIAVACALGYLDFRFPDLDWRVQRPGLSDWYGAFAERPSMKTTRPD